ncbi:MAG: hypothetical protein A2Y76_12365 [Planctomycetes bacterium RBG_13_60_9]|nr:MAG: hypothetical protein A2Y76_12365 [Planctomycetes bacterium RBG_13_60_9]
MDLDETVLVRFDQLSEDVAFRIVTDGNENAGTSDLSPLTRLRILQGNACGVLSARLKNLNM